MLLEWCYRFFFIVMFFVLFHECFLCFSTENTGMIAGLGQVMEGQILSKFIFCVGVIRDMGAGQNTSNPI